ncbi:conserved hypothetical protein [Mesorhizobium sp. SOD10]|nr:conserved hypothetical protein [Mesorhizobium sp. SOD10]
MFRWSNPAAHALNNLQLLPKRISSPSIDSGRRNLTDLFARPAGFMALLSAVHAFAAIGFQAGRNSVISLDLTGIIAFDAFREWEAGIVTDAGPGVGLNVGAAFTNEKRSVSPGSRGRL